MIKDRGQQATISERTDRITVYMQYDMYRMTCFETTNTLEEEYPPDYMIKIQKAMCDVRVPSRACEWGEIV
jgi:hypothetical protein